MRKIIVLIVGLALFVPEAAPYHPTIKRRPDLTTTQVRWTNPNRIPYFVNSKTPLDFSLQEAVDAVQASFQTWEDVETAGVSFEYAGLTDAKPSVLFDGQNTLGFSGDPDLKASSVVAITYQLTNVDTGEILEADIDFSEGFFWSVDPNGEKNKLDFNSTATHEIGHFLGLNHSHVGFSILENDKVVPISGAAIMYSFGFGAGATIGRFLKQDDIAGVSLLYPAPGYLESTGSISGRITKAGSGVAYAHIVTFNPATRVTIGAFADFNGNYVVEGLSPGPHVVRVNPITDPNSPSDFSFPPFIDIWYRDAIYQGGEVWVNPGVETTGIDVEVSR
jgi:hypothetical protein